MSSSSDNPAGPDFPQGSFFFKAVNYAPQSANLIHQDDFAKQFNFAGGLVPGVGIYSLMAEPFARHMGERWLYDGWLHAKFIEPVYDGERVEIVCDGSASDSSGLAVRVMAPQGRLCAIGSAGLRSVGFTLPNPEAYPCHPVPSHEKRLEPFARALRPGQPLGSIPVACDLDIEEDRYFEELRVALPLCSAGGGRFHPGMLPHIANRLVHRNIAVGPWIHTESRVTHFAPVFAAARPELRGKIGSSFQKRGHEYVSLDLAVFDEAGIPLAHLEHIAIVHPRLEQMTDQR